MVPRLRDLPLILTIAVFCVGAGQSPGAESWPVPRGPSREPAPYRYDSKVWRAVPKQFREDAPAVILYSGTTHIIEDDGTIETTTHEVTRLNGRKGVEALGEYRNIYFDPDYQKLVLNEARVLKANGTIVAIQPKHVQLRDVATDYQIYDPDKQLVISFPNLEVGDVYEVKWTVRGRNPEFAGKFFTRYTFGDDTYPVVQDELHVLTSTTQVFPHTTLGGAIDLRVGTHQGRKHYCWKVANRPELSREDDRPSKEEQRLQVACSTFATWDEVAEWKQKLRADCWKCLPPVQKTIDEVTVGLKTPLEKARALTYWVRRHIRYLSRGPAGAGYTPHLPHQVLANLFGDCKDQAQLLAVMLRTIGLDPYLVTIATLDDGQITAAVPSPWGTHALVMVTIDGRDYWVDTTVPQAAWDYLPRADRDRVGYLTRRNELKLQRTPAMTYGDNSIEQTTFVAMQPDGTSHNRRVSVYRGASALARRDAWIEVPPGERRRLVSAELQEANQRTRLLSLNVDDHKLLDFGQPVEAQLVYEIPAHFTGESRKEGSLSDSQVWNRLLSFAIDPERKLPLHLGTPFESKHRFIVELPPAYRFADLPASQDIESAWGFFKLAVRADAKNPRHLELVMHARLAGVLVEPKDFAAFHQFHDDVNKCYRVWLYPRPTGELADTPLLEATLALAPWSDPVSASTLAQLYLDQGRFDDARRVLRTACLFHKQDRGLWDLRVKAAATLAEEEDIYRAMLQQFPEDSRLKVALGTIRLRRGDHRGARQVLEPLTVDRADTVRGLAHYQLARCYFLEDQYKAALKHLEAAGESDPQVLADAAVLEFKARVHEKLGQTDEAIAAYREVVAQEADASDALVSLIGLELRQKQTREALDHLRRLTLAALKEPARLPQAAELHLRMDRLGDALELAMRAREAGLVVNSQRVLGIVYLRKNDLDKAVFHLERADADAEVLEGLIRAYLLLGDVRKAQRHYDIAQALDEDKDTPELRRVMGQFDNLLSRRERLWKAMGLPEGKKDLALASINRFLCMEVADQDPSTREQATRLMADSFKEGLPFGPTFALRGLFNLDKGNLKAAFVDAQKALEVGPVDARAYYVRGRVRLEKGEAGAISDLERAATLSNREDGTILHWLGGALFELGRLEDAITVQRRAVALRPHDSVAAEQLSRFEKAVIKAGL
jgi:tetratricopeptide (TPR) repeat protein